MIFNFPKSILFIIGNEFCERFSFYGMQTILSIYLNTKLHFSEDTSTVIYHIFSFFVYFSPILGAWLSDQYFGKYNTIVWISFVYVVGHVVKTIGAIHLWGIPQVELSLLGLALIALGTGGIKPCVSSFGGDQFKLPEQEKSLKSFFALFYCAIKTGSLISTIISPILRQDVHCFGEDTCFPLAFGIPAALMLLATIILIIGKPLYIIKPPSGNITAKVCGTIWYALIRKIRSGKKEEHWLDSAKEKYDPKFVEDIKGLLKVFVLLIPLPFFWSLFKQQGSRWTFQATRMNGDVGGLFTIKPDQMPVVNPLLIVILIPIFEFAIYPLFKKINFLVKPLQRMVAGGLMASLAFFIAAIIELELQKSYSVVPSHGESHLHLMNTLNCNMTANLNNNGTKDQTTIRLNSSSNHIFYRLSSDQEYELKINLENCFNHSDEKSGQYSTTFRTVSEHVTAIYILRSNGGIQFHEANIMDDPNKSSKGQPKYKFIIFLNSPDNETAILRQQTEGGHDVISVEAKTISDVGVAETDYVTSDAGHFDVYYKGTLQNNNDSVKAGSVEIHQGGVYTIAITENEESEPEMKLFQLTPESTVHILWLVPQYFVLTVGEILFAITGLEFSYSQAPYTLKAVVQAAWLLTIAFGNLIVAIAAEFKSKSVNQAAEFFIFASVMLLDIIIFAVMAYYYTYVFFNDSDDENEERNKNNNIGNKDKDNSIEMGERNVVENEKQK